MTDIERRAAAVLAKLRADDLLDDREIPNHLICAASMTLYRIDPSSAFCDRGRRLAAKEGLS